MNKWKTRIALCGLCVCVSAQAELIDKRTHKADAKPLAVHPSPNSGRAEPGAIATQPVSSQIGEAPEALVVENGEPAPMATPTENATASTAEPKTASLETVEPAPAPVQTAAPATAPVDTKAAEVKPEVATATSDDSAASENAPTLVEAKDEMPKAPKAEVASVATTPKVIIEDPNRLHAVPAHIRVDNAYLLEPMTGFGNEVPVSVALKQIVPDMQLVGQSPLDKTLVTWGSTGTRMDALNSIMSKNKDFALVIDGSQNVVSMMDKKAATEYAKTEADRVWRVLVGDARIDRSIERWAREAGYSFRWDADRHFLVSASSEFTGTIESAVNELLSTSGIRHSDYPLEACIYANSPPLLRITRLGDQSNQCR